MPNARPVGKAAMVDGPEKNLTQRREGAGNAFAKFTDT